MSVEDVHFRRDWLSAEEIGWRAASAALSDLAAIAARPIGVLISCALAESDTGDYAAGLMDGVRAATEAVGGAILGGDLTRSSGPLVLDVTVVGEISAPVLRSGARPGDEVWVTGSLGGAALAVARLLSGQSPEGAARQQFARPLPRIHEARWLVDRVAPSAMIDISDGLSSEVAHIATASGVALVLDPATIPIHPDVVAGSTSPEEALHLAMTGGEDYELCFTAPPDATQPQKSQFQAQFDLPLTRIGTVEAGTGTFRTEPGGQKASLTYRGFQHFDGTD
ncbi:thiamine-phosphate kinase [soil metagenome]